MTPVDDVFVAIDVGTSGARAVAITLAGRVVAQERRPIRFRGRARALSSRTPLNG